MTTHRDSENSNIEITPAPEQSAGSTPEDSDRRILLKKLAIGTAAVAGYSVLPNKWTSPIVEFGALPAHAATSGPAVRTAVAAASGTEEGLYHGRTNGDRPTWYFSKQMKDYPQQFTVVVDGCVKVEVTSNNGTRFVNSDGTIVKQSDVRGRGLALVVPSSCHSRTAHLVL